MRHPLLEAGDMKILIGLLLCAFYAHVDTHTHKGTEGEGEAERERQRKVETGKLRQ